MRRKDQRIVVYVQAQYREARDGRQEQLHQRLQKGQNHSPASSCLWRRFILEILAWKECAQQHSVGYCDRLKIRKEPNANSEIITTAKYNDEIKIIEKDAKTDFVNGENGKWYKVEYENQEGYAWSKFISE